ncbi:hypothetical protein ACJX0J_012209 [Zea mays]
MNIFGFYIWDERTMLEQWDANSNNNIFTSKFMHNVKAIIGTMFMRREILYIIDIIRKLVCLSIKRRSNIILKHIISVPKILFAFYVREELLLDLSRSTSSKSFAPVIILYATGSKSNALLQFSPLDMKQDFLLNNSSLKKGLHVGQKYPQS